MTRSRTIVASSTRPAPSIASTYRTTALAAAVVLATMERLMTDVRAVGSLPIVASS